MFYEDVPHDPVSILRLILPQPVCSEGDKLHVGGVVRCTYRRGHLLKRITAAEVAQHLRFEVIEHRLGIERFAEARQGMYELRAIPGGTDVALTTLYEGRMGPRAIWRPFERFVCHRVHRHILLGMRERLGDPSCASRYLEPTSGMCRRSSP
jgi:hypothetical protein